MTDKVELSKEEWAVIQTDVAVAHQTITSSATPWQLREGEAGLMAARREAILVKLGKLLTPEKEVK